MFTLILSFIAGLISGMTIMAIATAGKIADLESEILYLTNYISEIEKVNRKSK